MLAPLLLTFNVYDWCLDCDRHVDDVGDLDDNGRCDCCNEPDYDPDPWYLFQ